MPVYSARPSSPALAPYVESLHYLDAEESGTPPVLERILPNARIHLMVNLYEDEFRAYDQAPAIRVRRTHGAVLAGPSSQPVVIDTREQRRLATVDFKMGGAAPFFPAPLSEVHDQLVELDHMWGRDGAVRRERLLEARIPEAKLRILEAVLLDRAQVGLTPKRFSRVRRLQRVVHSIGDPGAADWSAIAAAHGYTDRAHLIHDFRELTGITPGAYRPRSPAECNHVPVAALTCR